MDLEANKAFSNRVSKAISAHDLEAFDDLMVPELAATLKQRLSELYQAFPDYHGHNQEQIAQGDKVVNRWVYTGTHRGVYKGIAASGKTITFCGLSIDHIVEGKLVSAYGLMDELDVLEQLGVELPG